MATNTETRLLALEKKVRDLRSDLDGLIDSIKATYQTKIAAAASEAALDANVDSLTDRVDDHDAKFTTVQLPEETQFYLKEQDIKGLKRIVAQAASIKVNVDRTMKALLSAWQQFKKDQSI